MDIRKVHHRLVLSTLADPYPQRTDKEITPLPSNSSGALISRPAIDSVFPLSEIALRKRRSDPPQQIGGRTGRGQESTGTPSGASCA